MSTVTLSMATFPLAAMNDLTPSTFSFSSDISPPNEPEASASSSTSITDIPAHSSSSRPSTSAGQRRIRFAPLPDPRRSVLITNDGGEVHIAVPNENHFSTSQLLPGMTAELCDLDPLCNDEGTAASSSSSTNGSYVSSYSSSSTPTTTTPSEYSPVSSVGSSPVIRDTTALPPATMPKSSSASTSAASWPRPRSLNLLRPFKRSSTSSSGSSSHSLTPTSSIDNSTPKGSSSSDLSRKGTGHLRAARNALSLSTEEILTLGTINLFRTSSRDSAESSSTATATSGWTLMRGLGTSASGTTNGSPLAKTQSMQGYKSKSLFSSFASASSTSSLSSDSKSKSTVVKPKPPASKPFNRHKGTRMLNGRVYGSARSAALAANPFANARDEEPEFVEWGYGGMGSVKGAKSAGVSGGGGGVNWERLQGGAAVREGVGGATDAGRDADAEGVDDGSGMGWLKKRREERERKEKERLATLEVEKKPEDSESTPTPTRSSTIDDTPIANSETVPSSSAAMTDEPGPIATSPTSPVTPTLESAATIVASPFTRPAEPLEAEVLSPLSGELDSVSKEVPEDNTKEDEHAKDEEEHLKERDATTASSPEVQHLQEHAPDIVPVPARYNHHRRHSSQSGCYHRRQRTPTGSGLAPTPGFSERQLEKGIHSGPNTIPSRITKPTSTRSSTSKGKVKAEPSDANGLGSASDDSDASSSSSSSADSESEDDDREEDEEDEEEEKARQEGRRKTALGAGVEKVMRHKE